jgi:prepilin-type N-terminal cleavage/methylation domain-containing protein
MKPAQGAHSEAARPGSCAAGGHTAGDMRRAGMTLVELLTVMGIIAVVATMSVVTFAPLTRPPTRSRTPSGRRAATQPRTT